MNKKHIWLIAIVIIILIGVSILFEDRSQLDPQEEAERQTREAVKKISEEFLNNFIAIAPPSDNTEASERLLAILSEDALLEIDEETLSRDIALFVGVQDVPDMGFEIKDVSLEIGNRAVAEAELKYSGGSTFRNIQLLMEDEMWKVDAITQPIEDNIFLETGNLIINNPGFPEGVWYLVYEKEGSPALNKALIFGSQSICVIAGEETVCNPDSLEAGVRAEIEGIRENGEVEVDRLQIIE